MTEFTAANFDTLCQTPDVKGQIESLEASRKAAVGQFWKIVIGGLVATVVAAGAAAAFVSSTIAAFILIGGIVAVIIFANKPLHRTRQGLKAPVLHTLAQQGGMTYVADGFNPPSFTAAEKALFGGFLSDATFTDLFQGGDFAFYEADLERGNGKNRQTVFEGQMYGFKRGGTGPTTVIVPDRGLFNFFKPGKGMERVKFDSHPEFEKRFEVYSTDPVQAQLLLGAENVRQRLLELRAKGQLFGYIAADEALFAITGKNRFEPGSMFKSTGGQDRVRTMFDDVCASLAVLKDLRGHFG